MGKVEKIMSLIESVEDEVTEAAILADDGYTDEAKEAYAKAVSIKEQIKQALREIVDREPLSDGRLDNAYLCDRRIKGEVMCFRAGARYAEREHGIGA